MNRPDTFGAAHLQELRAVARGGRMGWTQGPTPELLADLQAWKLVHWDGRTHATPQDAAGASGEPEEQARRGRHRHRSADGDQGHARRHHRARARQISGRDGRTVRAMYPAADTKGSLNEA